MYRNTRYGPLIAYRLECTGLPLVITVIFLASFTSARSCLRHCADDPGWDYHTLILSSVSSESLPGFHRELGQLRDRTTSRPTHCFLSPQQISGCSSGATEPIRHGGDLKTLNGSRSPQQRAAALACPPRSCHQLPTTLLALQSHAPTSQLPRPCPPHGSRKGRSGNRLGAHVPSRSAARR